MTTINRPSDGAVVRFIREDIRYVEKPDGSCWAEADDLDTPLPLDRAEIVAAAAQLANYIIATVHDATALHRARRVLDDAITGGDHEAAGATIANQIIEGLGSWE